MRLWRFHTFCASTSTFSLSMQALLDFRLISFMVQSEESLEDFTTGGFADRVADALFGFVEAMAEVKIVPAVSSGDRQVNFNVKLSEFLNVGGVFVRVVEAIVDGVHAFASAQHFFVS